MSERLRLWCLRHGESADEAGGPAGAVPHAPLTARGLAQARRAGRLLAAETIAAGTRAPP